MSTHSRDYDDRDSRNYREASSDSLRENNRLDRGLEGVLEYMRENGMYLGPDNGMPSPEEMSRLTPALRQMFEIEQGMNPFGSQDLQYRLSEVTRVMEEIEAVRVTTEEEKGHQEDTLHSLFRVRMSLKADVEAAAAKAEGRPWPAEDSENSLEEMKRRLRAGEYPWQR